MLGGLSSALGAVNGYGEALGATSDVAATEPDGVVVERTVVYWHLATADALALVTLHADVHVRVTNQAGPDHSRVSGGLAWQQRPAGVLGGSTVQVDELARHLQLHQPAERVGFLGLGDVTDTVVDLADDLFRVEDLACTHGQAGADHENDGADVDQLLAMVLLQGYALDGGDHVLSGEWLGVHGAEEAGLQTGRSYECLIDLSVLGVDRGIAQHLREVSEVGEVAGKLQLPGGVLPV